MESDEMLVAEEIDCTCCHNRIGFGFAYKNTETNEWFCDEKCYFIEKQHKKLEELDAKLHELSNRFSKTIYSLESFGTRVSRRLEWISPYEDFKL